MPGAPVIVGQAPPGRTSPARQAAVAAPLTGAGFPSDLSFFIWLAIIGVIIPAVIVGGLRAGGFQFVFRGR